MTFSYPPWSVKKQPIKINHWKHKINAENAIAESIFENDTVIVKAKESGLPPTMPPDMVKLDSGDVPIGPMLGLLVADAAVDPFWGVLSVIGWLGVVVLQFGLTTCAGVWAVGPGCVEPDLLVGAMTGAGVTCLVVGGVTGTALVVGSVTGTGGGAGKGTGGGAGKGFGATVNGGDWAHMPAGPSQSAS